MNNHARRQALEQAVLQNPTKESADISALMQQDAEFKHFVLNVRQQQQQLEQALRIATPAELVVDLLQLPKLAKPRSSWLINLAVAASFAIVSVFATAIYTSNNSINQLQDIGGHALAHVRHEADYVDNHLEQQPLADVNAKLASFNASLADWSDEIIFARYCKFKGVRSLHLAIRTATGYATVFIVPKNNELDFISHFSDSDYHGLSLAMAQADVVIVSRESDDLTLLPKKLLANLRFSA